MRLSTLLFLLISLRSFSQKDTVYSYFNKSMDSTSKDSAVYTTKIFKEGNTWHRQDYDVNTNLIKMDGYYEDSNTQKANGVFKYYDEAGKISDSAFYEHGKEKYKYSFYTNHALKGYGIYDDDGNVVKQDGWTETGKEIPGYIYEKDPEYPGGIDGWIKYLERNLNVMVAVHSGAPVGVYTVNVQFMIDKDGNVIDVTPISIPAKCKPCAVEAVRVIREGGKWQPAIQFNQPVIYRHRQRISFAVQEEERKRKRDQDQ